MSLNKIVLMGRITKDIELKQTPNGVSVTSFSIACDRDYSKGDAKETDFIDIVAWKQTAEFVARNFGKGRNIVVSGRLQIREWKDKNGEKRRNAEVVAENVYFADSKRSEPSGQTETQFQEVDPDEDELPF